MEWVLVGIGTALAWLVCIRWAHKAALRDAASTEVQQFLDALDRMLTEPESAAASDLAMQHYRVYAARAADFARLSEGRAASGERQVKAAHWYRALQGIGMIDARGRPFTGHHAAGAFWSAVWSLEARAQPGQPSPRR